MEPRRIGPYRLERKIGAGGMGVVYAAWDERLKRRVALKRIHPEMAGDPLRRERFRGEARAVAQLDHPAIVRIHDLLEAPDGDWLVLQYVDGPTLAERTRSGCLPSEELLPLARDLLGALAAAHERGLLHRDLKAENVLLAAPGRALILDFGLAKLYAPEGGSPPDRIQTGTAGVVGTYRAMSPEQANGLPLDPRSDLFSLGALLYEAATGVSPFAAETPVATLARVCTYRQVPARDIVPSLPEPLSSLIDALLEKDISRRPGSAAQALARIAPEASETPAADGEEPDFDDTISDRPLGLHPTPPPPVPPLPVAWPTSVAPYRRLRARLLPLLTGLALAVALGLFAWRQRELRSRQETSYVAVARPEIGLGAGREEVALASAALQAATLRALASLPGIAALAVGAPEPGEPSPTVQRLSRLHAADEVLTSTLDCQARQCQVMLRRNRGGDGKLLGGTAPFDVPLDDLHLLDSAASTYLRPLYPELRLRTAPVALQVHEEDYSHYLRLQRQWQEARPADLEPLLVELDRIRIHSPRFQDAYLLAARIEGHIFFQTREARRLDHALGLIAEARRLAQEDPLPAFALFTVALNGGRLDQAEAALESLEERLPGDARLLQQRALLSEARGDRRKALELQRAAVERRPSALFLVGLANLEMRIGELEAARGTLRDLLRRIPHYSSGENLLAQLELENGDAARAADLYSDLARRRPSFSVLSNLGVSQILLGRFVEAAASFRSAYALEPTAFAALVNLADAETLLGHQNEAASLYRGALVLIARDPAPGNWQVLGAKAQAQAHLGHRSEAAATIQRAIVAAPDNPDVAFQAALVYSLIGETASALASAGRAVELGFNRRWFSLPWFDSLRREPTFRQRMEPPARAALSTSEPAAR